MKPARRRRGAALVEMALALAVLTPLLVWGILFTDAWHKTGNLHQAVIQGARFGSTLDFDPADPGAFRRAVQDEVLKWNAVPGLTRDNVRVSLDPADSARPQTVRVAIHGYTLKTPGAAYKLDGNPSSAYPYRGR